MAFDSIKTQAVLSYLPGYMWSNGHLLSTGVALPPTMHVNPENGEVRYYCRPIFEDGATIGMFIRKQGIVDALARGDF
jgi:hypothetical protein